MKAKRFTAMLLSLLLLAALLPAALAEDPVPGAHSITVFHLDAFMKTIDPSQAHGVFSVDPATLSAAAGQTVTLTVIPEEGYGIANLMYVYNEGIVNVVKTDFEVDETAHTYSFIMPDYDIRVGCSFLPVHTITVGFGEGHEALAQNFADQDGCTVDGGFVTMTIVAEYGANALQAVSDALVQTVWPNQNGGSIIHNGERLYSTADLGAKPVIAQYADLAELNQNDIYPFAEAKYTDDETVRYLLWEKPLTDPVSVAVEPLVCGTELSLTNDGSIASQHTDPRPSVTVTGADYDRYNLSWFKSYNAQENSVGDYLTGEASGGTDYYTFVSLRAPFGYYIADLEGVDTPGAKEAWFNNNGGRCYVTLCVTAMHDDGGTEGTEPTCTNPGKKEYVCAGCGEEIVETIDALGHDLIKTDAVKATCTEGGSSAYWTCRRDGCGKYFSDEAGKNEITAGSWVIDALGHKPGEPVKENEVAATTKADGSYDEVVYCTVCETELSRNPVTVPRLGPGKYTVTWKNADGTTLKTDSVEEGVTPAYKGETPVKADDDDYSYVFSGWDPEIVPVTQDEIYTAQFTATGKPAYTVIWLDGDGRVLDQKTWKAGKSEPTTDKIPTKAADGGYTFVFAGKWNGTWDQTQTIRIYTPQFTIKSPVVPSSWYIPPDTPPAPSKPTAPFDDISEEDSELSVAVKDLYDRGIMDGMSDRLFAPEFPMTRAMLVTVLYRLEGEPAVSYTGAFRDVPKGQWYTNSVEWAAAHGIVDGYDDGTFGVMDSVTREQLVTIFWRYAKYKGADVSVGEDTNILGYDDAFDVSPWAMGAMQWACGSDLLVLRSVSALHPGVPAARSEVAILICRYCKMTGA